MTKKFSTYIQILEDDGVDQLNHSVKNEFSYMLKEFAAWNDRDDTEKRHALRANTGKKVSDKDLAKAEGPAAYTPQQRAQAMARGEPDPASVNPETAPYTNPPENAPGTSLPPEVPPPAKPGAPTQPEGVPPPAAPVVNPGTPEQPPGQPEPPAAAQAQDPAAAQAQDPAAAQAQDPAAAQAQDPAAAKGGKTQGMLGKVWNHLGGDAKDAAAFFPDPAAELQTRINTSQPNEVKAANLAALATALGIEPTPDIAGNLPQTAQGIMPVGGKPAKKNPAGGPGPIKGGGNAAEMLKQQNASVDVPEEFISEGKFGDMMKKGWDTTVNAVKNPGETIKKVGSAMDSAKRVIGNVHAATGGTHGTSGTDISGLMSGKYKGKTAELNTVVNLMSKVLNAKTSVERTTAINNLNSNPDFIEFNRNKTPQEKQAFLQQVTALAQLQQP